MCLDSFDNEGNAQPNEYWTKNRGVLVHLLVLITKTTSKFCAQFQF